MYLLAQALILDCMQISWWVQSQKAYLFCCSSRNLKVLAWLFEHRFSTGRETGHSGRCTWRSRCLDLYSTLCHPWMRVYIRRISCFWRCKKATSWFNDFLFGCYFLIYRSQIIAFAEQILASRCIMRGKSLTDIYQNFRYHIENCVIRLLLNLFLLLGSGIMFDLVVGSVWLEPRSTVPEKR